MSQNIKKYVIMTGLCANKQPLLRHVFFYYSSFYISKSSSKNDDLRVVDTVNLSSRTGFIKELSLARSVLRLCLVMAHCGSANGRQPLDCKFAAVNEATAVKATEHLIGGLKHCRVNKTRVDRYKLIWSLKWHRKQELCGQIHVPIVNSA